MIEDVRLENVTLFCEFTCDDLAPVNFVIGENETGKSNLLRTLYAVGRRFRGFTQFDNESPVGVWLSLAQER